MTTADVFPKKPHPALSCRNNAALRPITPARSKSALSLPGCAPYGPNRNASPGPPTHAVDTQEFHNYVNVAVSRAMSNQSVPASSDEAHQTPTSSFSDSDLRIRPPHLPEQPTVLQRLHASRHFGESWRPRSVPPERTPSDIRNETPAERAKRLKTNKYRPHKASVSREQRRGISPPQSCGKRNKL